MNLEKSKNIYVNEKSLRFELTAVNLKTKYTETSDESFRIAYEKRKAERIQELKADIQTLENKINEGKKTKDKAELKNLKLDLQRVEKLTIETQTKETIGNMITLIANNLSKKSCFFFYTNNWKDEFIANAILHTMKYLHNFDENKVSERTQQKIKAFAYITQIVYTSFLSTITQLKKEQEKVKNDTQYESIENKRIIINESKFNDSLSLFYKEMNEGKLRADLGLFKDFVRIKRELSDLELQRNELKLEKNRVGADENWKRISEENTKRTQELKKIDLHNLKDQRPPKILEIHYETFEGSIVFWDFVEDIHTLEIECYFIKEKHIKKELRFIQETKEKELDFDW